MQRVEELSVDNMVSRSGRDVPNQFILRTAVGTYFKSYTSIIVLETEDGRIFLDVNKWDYSRTTGRYRNIFLAETKKETEAKIKAGVYKLVDLNAGVLPEEVTDPSYTKPTNDGVRLIRFRKEG